MTVEQDRRWTVVLDHLIALVPVGAVVVGGADGSAAVLADRLAAALRAAGRAGTVTVADGPGWQAHAPVAVWVRTFGQYRGDDADIVVDLHDPAWPVIRHVATRLGEYDGWHLTESRAFFAPRAATWDTRFGDDLPAYAAAVADAGLPAGAVAVDVGCGTGRAFPALRAAVGPDGTVVGIDVTPQMLAAATDRARGHDVALVLGDACRLPLVAAGVDAVFAAGLLSHLPDADAALRELARVTRPGGRLVLFHPSGRVALAARHGRVLRPDEPLAETPLRRATAAAGWTLAGYDDSPQRFLAVAVRRASA